MATLAAGAVIAQQTPPGEPTGEPRAPLGTPAPAEHAAPWLLPSGVLVFVDPASGRILDRPRTEQLAALHALRLSQAATRDAERDLTIDALPRFAVPGGYGLRVEGLFLSSAVIERAPDGTWSFGCLDPDSHVHDAPGSAGAAAGTASSSVQPAGPPER